MKTLYLDIFSGISGDMFLGAMLDLGVDLTRLEAELQKLGVGGYHLHASRRQNSNIDGIKFDVHLEADPQHEHEHEHTHSHTHEHAHADLGHAHTHEHEHTHTHTHAHGREHEHGHAHPHEHGHSHDHEHGVAHEHTHETSHAHPHDHEHGESRNFAEIREMIQRSSLSDWVKERSISVFKRVAAAEGKIHGKAPEEVHFHEVGALDSI